jgi:cyanophycinase
MAEVVIIAQAARTNVKTRTFIAGLARVNGLPPEISVDCHSAKITSQQGLLANDPAALDSEIDLATIAGDRAIQGGFMQCRIWAGKNLVMSAVLVVLLVFAGIVIRENHSQAADPVPATAAERAAAPNVLGLPQGAISGGGTLMVCGGGALPEEVYDEFVKLAGGPKSKLVLIPSAHPYENLEALNYRFNGWLQYSTESFHFLHAATREEAESEEFAKPLEDATGVWMSGGAQGRLADLYKGTRVEYYLQKLLERGGVIGGTSAGAAIMSQTMIRHGSSREAVIDAGFGLLQAAVVDQHFTERARHTRLLGALRENPEKIGIGVDEETAIIIRANKVRVLGQNRATVIVPAQNRTMSLHLLGSGEEAELIRGKEEADAPLKLQQSNLATK